MIYVFIIRYKPQKNRDSVYNESMIVRMAGTGLDVLRPKKVVG